MKQKVAFFHTTPATVQPMKQQFLARYPDVQLITILDDGILPEVIANGGTPSRSITRRLVAYGALAQEQGAAAFVCMCTTLGIAMREAQAAIEIPMLTIDGPMLQTAVQKGRRIGMLITFAPTEKPSRAACLAFAADAGKRVDVDVILVEGARDALNAGDKPLHDRLIEEKARACVADYDALVFAQATMTDAADRCADLPLPILTSVASGLSQLAPILGTTA